VFLLTEDVNLSRHKLILNQPYCKLFQKEIGTCKVDAVITAVADQKNFL